MADKVTKYKSKKFRVAVEGATTDGRIIEKTWIEQMAKNYSLAKYGARINIEHIKGYHPDSSFRAFGDVLSLSTETFKDGDKDKLALIAELSPTDDLVQYIQKRQKVYTSIEVNPKFADTGEAYLMGIAVTDTPASLGTEMLEFSSKAEVNPLAGRKTSAECLFTAAVETPLTFEVEGDSLSEKIKAFFSKSSADTDATIGKFKQEVESALSTIAAEVMSLKTQMPVQAQDTTIEEKYASLSAEFTALKEQLENTTNDYRHSPATGGDDKQHQTDC